MTAKSVIIWCSEYLWASQTHKKLWLGEKIYRAKFEDWRCRLYRLSLSFWHGNGPAGYPALGGCTRIYREATFGLSQGRRNTANARIVQGVAEALSDKEIKALANFIAGLN